MKVGFIRESFKGFKGFKSFKGLMTTVLVVLQCKGSGKSGDRKGFQARMYEMKNGVYESVFIHAISYLLFWIFIGIFLIVAQSQCTTLLLRSAQKSTQYKSQNIRDELF